LNAGEVHEQQTGGDPNAPGAKQHGESPEAPRRTAGRMGRARISATPTFQFDRRTGQTYAGNEGFSSNFCPKTEVGGARTFWLFQPHALLDGKRPADVFPTDPPRRDRSRPQYLRARKTLTGSGMMVVSGGTLRSGASRNRVLARLQRGVSHRAASIRSPLVDFPRGMQAHPRAMYMRAKPRTVPYGKPFSAMSFHRPLHHTAF